MSNGNQCCGNDANKSITGFDEKHISEIAEQLNEVLHSASVNKDDRIMVVTSLLLAQQYSKLDATPEAEEFVSEINNRVRCAFSGRNKNELYKYIEIRLPDRKEARDKFYKALVKAAELLEELKIWAVMDAGTDVLGKLYDTFLRYGNGPKDIGIVLTPGHIAEFACEVLDINHNDLVYDPTCGTGGFLVSALNKVRLCSSDREFADFRDNRVFGVEQQSKVAALAVANMIFHRAARDNIINNDCFSQRLTGIEVNGLSSARFLSLTEEDRSKSAGNNRVVTKVLMNPPFSLKERDEKEFRFIEHALEQMQDGGLLFSVVPYSMLVKQGQDRQFRKRLLRHNTLLSVITLPQDLFYPVGIHTAGIIIKKGVPHPEDRKVLWVRAISDGYVKVKGRRLPCEKRDNNIEQITRMVKDFIKDPDTALEEVKGFHVVCPVDRRDKSLELVPEAYLREREPLSVEEIKEGLEKTLREFLAFLIWSGLLPVEDIKSINMESADGKIAYHSNFKEVALKDILGHPYKGPYHIHGGLDIGSIPLISTSAQNNGVAGYFDVPGSLTFKDAITVTSDGAPLTAFYHPYVFTAKDNVIIFEPGSDLKYSTIFYIVTEINRIKWRFSYGRKCYLNKIDKVKIFIPVKGDGSIDQDYIEDIVNTLPGWHLAKQALSLLAGGEAIGRI